MVLVIAEAGVNHNGDQAMARDLIDAAVESGADIVKFQTFNASSLATNRVEQAEYQKSALDNSENQKEMLKKLEIDEDFHHNMIDYCNSRNIEFLSTAFDSPSIDLLSSLNIRRWKIPSGEITNTPYLREIARQRGEIILSTGMANLGEIEFALNTLYNSGADKNKITVLHCTSSYPAPINEINLKSLLTIKEAFKIKVGYSDHTEGIVAPICAVTLGAQIIEKHLTLNKNLPGPDHKASLEPLEFKDMVNAIRQAENAMGDGIKKPSPSEITTINVVRKSIVASRPISKGEIFSDNNLVTKRSGDGISAAMWDDWIGKYATRDFKEDECITG
ncbi:MAG: N-acetylneuraminate synthase [Rhodopirellula sp.]|nr:N-acetylneuraminate synthase [Rhodopirellula sp.]